MYKFKKKDIKNKIIQRLNKLLPNRNKNREDKILEFHKKRIPKNKFNYIKQKYINDDPYPGYSKYLELDKWLKKSVYYAQLLNLDKSKPLTILDMGTGAGYFPFVCSNYGHQCIGIDIPDIAMYNELIELLGVRRKDLRIKAFSPLPDFNKKFDLITAFSVCFNNHAKSEVWSVSEWGFHLADLAANHLRRDGEIFMELNAEPDGTYYSEDLRKFFGECGAVINENIVRFVSLDALMRACNGISDMTGD